MKDSAVKLVASVSQTPSTLLAQVQLRDQRAWERLVALYSPLVYHWCVRSSLQAADAEEVGQEVFLVVARHIEAFRHDRPGDTFRGWLRTITLNKIRDRALPPGGRGIGGSDAQEQLAQLGGLDPGSDSRDALEKEERLIFRRAVELIELNFEPQTRQAFWLVLGGRRPAEVAAELGLKVGAVYLAKSRILKRLREEFGDLLAEAADEVV